MDGSVQSGLSNATGRLLAIEELHPDRRRELLLALLQQLDQVLGRLRHEDPAPASWSSLQPELRRQALSSMAGHYVQIPRDGALQPVASTLLASADLEGDDDELPDPAAMLMPLLADQPVLVKGQLLPADDPRALLQLETLVSNWLVRTAELIGAELLEACGEWPELRQYLLGDRLLATRELDRLRNQLNNQLRWSEWIERPIQLYESQRTLYQLRGGRIEPLQLMEARDQELNSLGWWQRQVALLLETRDALAPRCSLCCDASGIWLWCCSPRCWEGDRSGRSWDRPGDGPQPGARLRPWASRTGLMGCLLPRLLSCVLALLMLVTPAQAVLNDDNYDGNIYALYAGNGSWPPANTLEESLAERRTVIVFYLDDSAVSKRFAPVVRLQRLWGRGIDRPTIDPLQGRQPSGAADPATYWRGQIPQVVVIDPQGEVVFDQDGQVSLVAINEAISRATGLPAPDLPTIDQEGSFNEVNIEVTSR